MLTIDSLSERRPMRDKVYDVIVAGGGPAAIGAALAAAIQGAQVLMLEARSQFGGTATAAMWMNFNWIFRSNGGAPRGGVCDILVDALKKWGDVASRPGRRNPSSLNDGGNLIIHPEYLKRVCFELLDSYRIDYSLYTPVVDVVKEGDTLAGVVVMGKEGRQAYRGKVVVDATGDGDVAFLAGCEMEDGNPSDGWRAPISLLFALDNVDVERFWAWYRGKDISLDGKTFESYRDVMIYAAELGYFVPRKFVVDIATIPNVININYHTTRGWRLDGTKSYDLTCVEKLGIVQATDFVRFATEHAVPGLEHAGLVRTGAYAAVRETRRLVGEYVFTEEDLLSGTQFEDAVASKYGGRDGMGESNPRTNIKQGALYPYRSMLPKTVEGLLVAGRCASASFRGHYGGKSMGNMMVIGQAAGVAAALCARSGVSPRALPPRQIQEALKAMHVEL